MLFVHFLVIKTSVTPDSTTTDVTKNRASTTYSHTGGDDADDTITGGDDTDDTITGGDDTDDVITGDMNTADTDKMTTSTGIMDTVMADTTNIDEPGRITGTSSF